MRLERMNGWDRDMVGEYHGGLDIQASMRGRASLLVFSVQFSGKAGRRTVDGHARDGRIVALYAAA
jgi:hypothetical protein